MMRGTPQAGPSESEEVWPISPDQVTVAVEGWNGDDLESRAIFERSLTSLERQTYPIAQCEVLVLMDADGASDDEDWVRRWPQRASVVRVPGATHYRLRKAAVHAAHAEFRVFGDSSDGGGRDSRPAGRQPARDVRGRRCLRAGEMSSVPGTRLTGDVPSTP
jgi:hypothetical protein